MSSMRTRHGKGRDSKNENSIDKSRERLCTRALPKQTNTNLFRLIVFFDCVYLFTFA